MHPTAPNPRARCPAPALGSGLTLIELMIVLVITAILAAVAYPSYLQMLYKSRRADAMAGLGTMQQAQERYRSNSAIYQATLADLVGAASTTSPSGYYTLTIFTANATGYTLRATADSSGKQAGDSKCQRFESNMANGTLGYSSYASGNSLNVAPDPCWVK